LTSTPSSGIILPIQRMPECLVALRKDGETERMSQRSQPIFLSVWATLMLVPALFTMSGEGARFMLREDAPALEYSVGSSTSTSYSLTINPNRNMIVGISGQRRGSFTVSPESLVSLFLFMEENGFMEVDDALVSKDLEEFRRYTHDRGTVVDGGEARITLRLKQYRTEDGKVIKDFEKSLQLDNPIRFATLYPEVDVLVRTGRIFLELQTLVWQLGAPQDMERRTVAKEIADLRTSLGMSENRILTDGITRIEDK